MKIYTNELGQMTNMAAILQNQYINDLETYLYVALCMGVLSKLFK